MIASLMLRIRCKNINAKKIFVELRICKLKALKFKEVTCVSFDCDLVPCSL